MRGGIGARVGRGEEDEERASGGAHFLWDCLVQLREELGLRLQLLDRILIEVGLEDETEQIVRLRSMGRMGASEGGCEGANETAAVKGGAGAGERDVGVGRPAAGASGRRP